MDNLHFTQPPSKDREKQVEDQFKVWESTGAKAAEEKTKGRLRFITVSREYGCAGFRIGDRLAEALNANLKKDQVPWTVYDHMLVDLVCKNHKLSRVLVESLDRQRKNVFSDYITGIFTGEPSSIKVFKKFAETTFQLAAKGRVIVIGRASSLITGKLTGGFHVRVVAPLEWRVKQIADYEKIEPLSVARRYVEKQDVERENFAQDFLGKNVRDADSYHLIFNQEKLGIDSIVKLILDALDLYSTA